MTRSPTLLLRRLFDAPPMLELPKEISNSWPQICSKMLDGVFRPSFGWTW